MKTNLKSFQPVVSRSSVEVRYAETDQMGVVHHAVYPVYFEQGRIDWLRIVGMHYQKMEDNGIMLPLHKLSVDFKKPAKFGDVLTVTTILKKMPSASINFNYQIHNQDQDLLTEGETVLVFVDKTTRKPMRCPEEVMNLILKATTKD